MTTHTPKTAWQLYGKHLDRHLITAGNPRFAECIYEPRGDYGLEGYQLNNVYRFELKKNDTQEYFKVFPTNTFYGETCGKGQFRKCFKIVKETNQ